MRWSARGRRLAKTSGRQAALLIVGCKQPPRRGHAAAERFLVLTYSKMRLATTICSGGGIGSGSIVRRRHSSCRQQAERPSAACASQPLRGACTLLCLMPATAVEAGCGHSRSAAPAPAVTSPSPAIPQPPQPQLRMMPCRGLAPAAHSPSPHPGGCSLQQHSESECTHPAEELSHGSRDIGVGAAGKWEVHRELTAVRRPVTPIVTRWHTHACVCENEQLP
jgi:hypothetical protein